MGFSGKKLKNIGCAFISAVSILAFSGCSNYSEMMEEQPQEYISLASENTAKSMMKNSFKEEYAILEEALKEGTFNVSLDVEGITLGGEFYVNAKDYLCSQLYSIGAGNKEIELYVASDKDGIKLGTLSESGNHIYEINFNAFAEDFAESVFAPDSGSEFALAQSDYDILVEAYSMIADMFNSADNSSESFAEFEAVINKFMEDNEPEVEEKVNVEIGDDEVKANIITYKFDKDDVCSLLNNYMDVVIDTFASIMNDGDYSSADLKDESMAEINQVLESVEKMDMELVYYVNGKTNSLMQVDINVDASVEGEAAEIELVAILGAEPEKAEEQSLDVNIKAGGQTVGLTFAAESSENSTKITVDFSSDAVKMELITITCERNNEDYTIEFDIPMANASGKVEGTIKTENDACEFTVDEFYFTDGSEEYSYSPNFKIRFAKGGEYNDLDAEKNLLKLTEEDVEQLASDLVADFMAFAGNINSSNVLSYSMINYAA